MSRILYIAYGSNLNVEQMAYRCRTAKVLGSAMLTGYQLLFRGGSGAVATIEKRKGSKIPVLVWEIGPEDEVSLDRYEGFPVFYRKEYIKLRFKGKWVQVMVYLMNDGRQLGFPSRYYYDVILQGYNTAGFDTGILNTAVRISAGKDKIMDMFFYQKRCDRCGGDLRNGRTMSMFNEDCICFGCSDKEKLDKDYAKAVEADHEQIRQGNYNFKGIRGGQG